MKAVIVNIPKPGKDAHDAEAHTPIALLPVPRKIFEKTFAIGSIIFSFQVTTFLSNPARIRNGG